MSATGAEPPPQPSAWTANGFLLGARMILPAFPGVIAFALAVGAVGAQKGLSLSAVTAMSAGAFAGASQLAVIELWPDRWTVMAILTIAFVTLTVNLRFILTSASVRPWMGNRPTAESYLGLFFLTESTWVMFARYRAEGGRDAGVLLGSGVTLWACWVGATAAGHILGASVPDPREFGLDLVMPAFFVAMTAPLWRGRRETVSWTVAGTVALAVDLLLPGSAWYIIAGVIAGGLAGSFIDGD